ncbi:gluconate 2-dehydrogenase subunit 3 family protein [Phenylobacterium sp.]|uniref:gluconate 2-dehydrogenase subunit 3 family protein n=1 Tax=Phenylobacterium sp. TaxID=1871053 RepID=UPI00260BCB90|nr:gluconate 2-dehydrogenase subunit 3 family protein [Phenylobacterium sp.]HSC20558.1 gluconate 2-dehydrogenase subunit 3 family protein [Solirubrobacterales bacterium]
MPSRKLSRRGLLAAAAGLPVAPAAIRGGEPWREGAADAPTAASGRGYSFFTAPEAAFIEAAVARLIPKDELGPGALEVGVVTFIDRQLAGEFGRGARWYMQGPWGAGEKTQGYQTRLTPAGVYRAAIGAIDAAVAHEGKAGSFARLALADQDDLLHRLEKGQLQLAGVDGVTFFDMLLQNTLEGFWSDPIYGGNRDMAGWKLIGFPGARYDQTPFVGQHGKPYPLPPVGLKGRPAWNRS